MSEQQKHTGGAAEKDAGLVYGKNPVTELLKSGAVVCLDAKAGRVTAC